MKSVAPQLLHRSDERSVRTLRKVVKIGGSSLPLIKPRHCNRGHSSDDVDPESRPVRNDHGPCLTSRGKLRSTPRFKKAMIRFLHSRTRRRRRELFRRSASFAMPRLRSRAFSDLIPSLEIVPSRRCFARTERGVTPEIVHTRDLRRNAKKQVPAPEGSVNP